MHMRACARAHTPHTHKYVYTYFLNQNKDSKTLSQQSVKVTAVCLYKSGVGTSHLYRGEN